MLERYREQETERQKATAKARAKTIDELRSRMSSDQLRHVANARELYEGWATLQNLVISGCASEADIAQFQQYAVVAGEPRVISELQGDEAKLFILLKNSRL